MDKREYISPSVETTELQEGSLICVNSLRNEEIQPGDHIIEWGF